MSTEATRQFHLARYRAEYAAAERAACDMTRAIHAELAKLHADRAGALRSRQSPSAVGASRQGMSVRVGLCDAGTGQAASV